MKDKDKEIKEALEIIKKPITVNSVEYKYFDLENYNKIVNVFDEFSFLLGRVEPYIEEQQKIINKYKKVLDKIKEYIETTDTFQLIHSTDGLGEKLREKTKKDLLELLEEIE